ncbi:MAG: bifunctional riboflavin kinase/FAD synthetase [Clostridiales bacterium]|nr:bifunctional riboflavin kinase/FAD synthetase [Clostridiales bacterium]
MEYLALGNFDGIHLGHQSLIKDMVSLALKNNATPSVCIFSPHPMKVLFPEDSPKMLTTLEYKKNALYAMGIVNIHILPFSEDIHNMHGIDFLDMLKVQYDVGLFAIGYNYAFGKNGKWKAKDIKKYCKNNNIKSYILEKYMIEGLEVSSTIIRENIKSGQLDIANKLLGRPQIIEGVVIEGSKLGRDINFPTANIAFDEELCYPPFGVYFTITKVDGTWHYSVTNIGNKPTIADSIVNIETHILNYDANIYGKKIYVGFMKKLRNQIRFDDIESLQSQILQDSEMAKEMSKNVDLNLF